MAYKLPTFNLDVNIWRQSSDPDTDPPDVVTTGNLAWGKRTNGQLPGFVANQSGIFFTMLLLVPALTDIRGEPYVVPQDIVEVPAGSARFYTVFFVDDIGKGFSNEHRAAVLRHNTDWPAPTP